VIDLSWQQNQKQSRVNGVIMSNKRNLRFLERKMKLLGTAIFSNYSEAVFKFPSCLVSKMKFDTAGDILFFIENAYEDMNGFDLEFPGHLYFFNKAFDYYIEAEGKATIVLKKDKTVVRFRIAYAQYFYSAKMRSRGVIRLIYTFMELLYPRKISQRLYDYPV